MSTNFDYAREIQKTREASEMSAACAWDMADTLDGMSRCLGSLHQEMYHARQAGEQALAIQQQLLQQQQFQAYLEELIYKADKMLTEFRDPHTSVPAPTRYYFLTGMLKDIRDDGICTAVIQGRDNKAAFEKCQKEAMDMLKRLHDHPEVKEALAWEKEHRKRLEDQRHKEEEARRKQAEEEERQRRVRAEEEEQKRRGIEARRTEIHKKIEQLQLSKKRLSFVDWHKTFFKFAFDQQPPWPYIIVAIIWIAYGFMWIPVVYMIQSASYEQRENPEINGEIKSLQEQLAKLE